MCGFFISNDPSVTRDKHEKIIEETLRFRGPDGSSGLISHNGWKAYHARLSIIDIDSGVNQPLINNNGLLVFNGEILNYKELGIKYFNKEYHSDTILLNDLLQNNILDLPELDGFFSFVYIQENEIKYSARDSFGVKPLFFHKNNEFISFSSEPNTLRRIFNLQVNNDSIEEYKSTRAPIFSGSYFNEIDEIKPGHCLINGCYFNINDHLTGEYSETDLKLLEAALKNSIASRKISDAPVGLLLSKGVDSNLVNSLGQFDNLYSIGFPGDEDIEFLRKANIQNLTIHETTPEEYKEAFYYLLNLRGEPMSVPNEVLLYLIAKKAANNGVKVLLSGEGADEFFGGYDRIFSWAAQAETFNLNEFLSLYCYSPPNKGTILYNKFKLLFEINIFQNTFETVRWFFIKYHLPILFRRLDFSLMAAGIEGREPIANMHLFEFAKKMNANTLIKNNLGKIPLRELIEKYMGTSFAYDKKVGFPVDLTRIFNNENNFSSYELWFHENLKVLK